MTIDMTLVVSGGIMSVVGVVVLSVQDIRDDVIMGTAFSVAGGLCLGGGIPLMIVGGTKKNNALNMYRRQYTSTQTTPYFQLNLHGNGMGLAYVF